MDQIVDKPEISSRIKNFTYYFLKKIEGKFLHYLDVLEDAGNGKPSSKAGTAISAAAGIIPYVGKGISSALKEGDTMLLNKLDKSDALASSSIVYLHRNDRDEVRKVLVRAAYELFCCYEAQFLEVTCGGGPTRAAQKLGYDAGQRFLSYVVKEKPEVVTEEMVLRSIVVDKSNFLNTLGIVKEGRTIKDSEDKDWSTAKIYGKVGVYVRENEKFYVRKSSNVKDYGYRLKFAHEKVEDFESNWVEAQATWNYEYVTDFVNFDEDFSDILVYIYKKNPEDYAKHDREMRQLELTTILEEHHVLAMEDADVKHAEATEHREQLHADVKATSSKHHEEVTTILHQISEKQDTISLQHAPPAAPSLEENKAVVQQVFNEDVNVLSKIGTEFREELKKIDPTRTHEFKRLKNHIRKMKF